MACSAAVDVILAELHSDLMYSVCFQAQKSVNMLTSLKLNAVQVIKFTGEYNYIVLCEGGVGEGDNIRK